MHELVRCVFFHLPEVDNMQHSIVRRGSSTKNKVVGLGNKYSFNSKSENVTGTSEHDSQSVSGAFTSSASTGLLNSVIDEGMVMSDNGKVNVPNNLHLMTEPYGVPCMVEIFHFLCSLLNVVEHIGVGPRANTTAFDEDVPLFALCLINSAIELGGPAIRNPRLLSLVQDELFQNLMIFGLSMSPVILSTVCSIVLNLYQHLRTELKLQLEAFLSCVVLRLAQSRYGASYQQQEVAMEALVTEILHGRNVCKFRL